MTPLSDLVALGASTRRSWLGRMAAGAFAVWGRPGLAAGGGTGGAPLQVALSPFLSPAALLKAFGPLREHVARATGRPVELFTAPDLRGLIDSVRQQRCDVALLPPHVARLAIEDWGYQPLAGGAPATGVVVVVRDGGPVRDVLDLRGARIGVLDPLTLTWSMAASWLRSAGVDPERGVQLVVQRSGNTALFALQHGDIDAAVATTTQLLAMPKDTPPGRVLKHLGEAMGPVYVARGGLSPVEFTALREAFLSVRPDPGLPSTTSNMRLLPLTAESLASMAPHVQEARRQLATGR